MTICENCEGTGHIEEITNLTWGGDIWSKPVICPTCHGEGEVEEPESEGEDEA